MKKLLAASVALAASSAFASESVELTKENTLVLRGPVTDDSMSKLSLKLFTMPTKNVYLFLDSPGGSVFAAAQFMDSMKASGKNITCISSFAASAAFAIMQRCNNRLILPSGVMMQHQASWGMRRSSARQQESMMKFFTEYTKMFSAGDYARIGITKEEYEAKVAHDWWLNSEDAVKENVVDGITTVSCSPKLAQETFKQTVYTFFGPVKITWSRCPLSTFPVKIDFSSYISEKPYKVYNRNDYIKNFKK